MTHHPEPEQAHYDVHRVTEPEPRYLDQIHALLGEMVQEGAALGWVDPPTRSDVGELLADLIQGADFDDACLAVAERVSENGDDTQVVGFAYWTRREGATEQPHADIARVAVSSHARGGGLGRRLVETLVDYARKVGVEILTLDCRGNNHAAMHVYERLGFKEYGRIPDFVAIDNERWDNVYFSLDLRGPEEHEDLVRHGDTPRGAGASELRS
ncbi:MAG: GNAT family N-acetyltransferase [Nocardioidaceae bacterium]